MEAAVKETGYCIYHFEKFDKSSNMKGLDAHIMRTPGFERSYGHADPERFKLNRDLSPIKFKNLPLRDAVNLRINEGYTWKKKDGSLRKIKTDAVLFHSHVLTASHNQMFDIFKKDQLFETWIKANYLWLAKEFGKENIVRFVIHLDEKTPHIHAITVPITHEGRLSADAYTGNKGKLADLQNSYGETMAKFGLERGLKQSGRIHTSTREFYYKMVNGVKNSIDAISEEIDKKVSRLTIDSLNIDEAAHSLEERKNKLKQELKDISENKIVQEAQKILNQKAYSFRDKVYLSENQTKTLEEIVKKRITVLNYFKYLNTKGLVKRDASISPDESYQMYFNALQKENVASIAVNGKENYFVVLDSTKTPVRGDVLDAVAYFENASRNEALRKLANISEINNVRSNIISPDFFNVQITDVHKDITNEHLKRFLIYKGLDTSDVKDYAHQVTWVNKKTGNKYYGIGFNCNGNFDLHYRYWAIDKDINVQTGILKPIIINVGEANSVAIKVFGNHFDFLAYRKAFNDGNYKAVILNNLAQSKIHENIVYLDQLINKETSSVEFYLDINLNKIYKTQAVKQDAKFANIILDVPLYNDAEVKNVQAYLKLKHEAQKTLEYLAIKDSKNRFKIIELLDRLLRNVLNKEQWGMIKALCLKLVRFLEAKVVAKVVKHKRKI
ncbi:MAG: MobV family relaxase [Solitalea-like symbiont of Acarus siro]